jgi:hypothetical protein
MTSAAQGLEGVWTYRSFINNPQPVGDDAQAALNLIFGEGELTIETASDGVFKAALSFGGNAIMDLDGTIERIGPDVPFVIFAQGAGRPGSGIEDFHYDYAFYTAYSWPNGIDQRPALVGTVVRAADHGTAKKGVVASTVTVRQD